MATFRSPDKSTMDLLIDDTLVDRPGRNIAGKG
jgi:hypothetical protein